MNGRFSGLKLVFESLLGQYGANNLNVTMEMTDLLHSPLTEIKLECTQANGINIRYAHVGDGPVVLFCHGWPESWYSWRHQMLALAQAGYRCIAPDMRGYGGTSAPDALEAYTQLHIVGDMVELLRVLNVEQAVVVGHDWGAPIAWHCALLRPDVFRAVVGMSVPWSPPAHVDFLSALHKRGISRFYMQYFQLEGVAEAEFERDIAQSLRRIYYSASADAPREKAMFGMLPDVGGFLDTTLDPQALPSWFQQADLEYLVAQFTHAGFRGGLNWYRNLRRSWELMGPWRGQYIMQPSMFIVGERDGVLNFPASRAQIAAYPTTLPGLRSNHELSGAGHWVQQEKPAEVSRLLLDFLKDL
jgi:pimeloyl-ACP methyl ester carboxylesterase